MDFKAINLGEMTLTNGQKVAPIALSDAKVTDEAFEEEGTVGGFRLSWKSDANKNNFSTYEIYQLNDDGSKEFLGASNINAFFVNALKRGKNINSTKFEIVPINKAGESGHSVTTSVKWPDNSLAKAAFGVEFYSNEDESIPELYAWIERVMKANNFSYEVIFINDGSTDRSWEIISELNKQQPGVVKGIKFRRNYGKSPALYCGFEQAQGDVVITMDADLQDSPDEIPELYRMIKEEGYDLVSGYKQKRYDPISKTIPTKLFNATARKISGIKNLHDFNCGLKAYRKAVVKNIEVYGEMHRYIPYLAKNAGFNKIGEKVVQHQARKYGSSKFMGLNRFVNGYLDLLTLWFLSTFGKKPMHVFGFLGTLMFFIGFISAAWIGADKLWCLANHIPQRLVTNSPFFYIALTMMLMGTQLFLTGFLGDLISRSSSGRNDYQIEEKI